MLNKPGLVWTWAWFAILPTCAILIAVVLNYGLEPDQAWQYKWLLTPESWCLQFLTGQSAIWQTDGYYYPDWHVLLHPQCSGLRFFSMLLIAMACGSAIYAVRSDARFWARLARLALIIAPVALLAWLLTCLAAVSRIYILLQLEFYGLTADRQWHPLVGSAVYLCYFMLASQIAFTILSRQNRRLAAGASIP
ncbi:MAG: hypothetical protein KDK39_16120 [Leptospiraceae bacterium]|nr:hypothetical protein [Leptospiraceae bacterium]